MVPSANKKLIDFRKKREADSVSGTLELVKLEKSLLVDTSMEKFKVIVTVTPSSLLDQVRKYSVLYQHPIHTSTCANCLYMIILGNSW